MGNLPAKMTGDLQRNQLRKDEMLPLRARHRAMYSTVKSATILVSKPNQKRADMVCDAGTVSITVTSEESTMRKVMKMWM